MRHKKNKKTFALHMNKTYWNSIILEGSVPDKDIRRMIRESYDLMKGKKK